MSKRGLRLECTRATGSDARTPLGEPCVKLMEDHRADRHQIELDRHTWRDSLSSPYLKADDEHMD